MAGGLGISPDLLEGAEASVAAPLMAGDLDDGLMSRARDTGKFLYKYLEPQERVEKINTMVRETSSFYTSHFEIDNVRNSSHGSKHGLE